MTPARPTPTSAVERALELERSRIGVRVNRARIVGLAGWIALGLGFGLGPSPEWLVPLPPLAVGLAIALALELAVRTKKERARFLWLATPLLDVPLVATVQTHFLSVSIRPTAVAIFTVALVSSLVFVSQLSFQRRGILLTLAGALVATAVIFDRASLPLPNMMSAVVLLGWAAAVALFSSARVQTLVATVASEQENREAELTALVAERTSQLESQNRALEKRGVELETAMHALASAQADLVRAEKLASVATLVKGIAHELNNPINYIVNNVPLLQRDTKRIADAIARIGGADPTLSVAMSEVDAIAQDIAEGARRSALIVGDLQNLTSAPQRSVEEVDLTQIARQTEALFAQRLSPRVRIELALADAARLRARAGQLEQVLVNLVDNAVRAVGESGVVKIDVVHDGDRITLRVCDDGKGMTDEERKHALDPFFTTRAAGEGSGLGLAIVAQIVEAHEGQVHLDSMVGRGTTITVTLPAIGIAA